VARPAPLQRRGAQAHVRPGVATGLAYTRVGGDVLFIEATAYPARAADDHRAARRGDAGVGAGGALVGARDTRAARRAARTGSRHTTSICTVPAGAVAEGRTVGGIHDGRRRSCRSSAVRPVSDKVGMDRRDHADGAGAADRGRPREDARRPAGRA
jgi:hypothetical protein